MTVVALGCHQKLQHLFTVGPRPTWWWVASINYDSFGIFSFPNAWVPQLSVLPNGWTWKQFGFPFSCGSSDIFIFGYLNLRIFYCQMFEALGEWIQRILCFSGNWIRQYLRLLLELRCLGYRSLGGLPYLSLRLWVPTKLTSEPQGALPSAVAALDKLRCWYRRQISSYIGWP